MFELRSRLFVKFKDAANLQIMGNCKGCPLLVDDGFIIVELSLHYPAAPSIGDQVDFGMYHPRP
jgi:hypothetical protein